MKIHLGIVIALIAAPSLSFAQDAPHAVRLDYRPAPNVLTACPDEENFRYLVGSFAGYDPFEPKAANTLRITIEKRGRLYHATIARLGPDGANNGTPEERSASHCELVADKAASVAALVATPMFPPVAVPPAPAPCQTCRDDKLDRRLDAIEEANEAQAATNATQAATIELLKAKIAVLENNGPMDLTFALSTGAFFTANLTSTVGGGAWFGGEARSGPISLGLELRTVLPARATPTATPSSTATAPLT